jgi:SAM-dependent methyltransferase
MSANNPWLAIPADDYEGHMGVRGVDQLGPLRRILAEVYAEARPARMAVLGCGTGNGLDVIDPAVTRRLLGVDLHPGYLSLARQRYPELAGIAEWMCADVERCQLDDGAFDLIHAALLFEYVGSTPLLPRIAGWLAPGGVLSVVSQLPGGDAPISDTGFASLRTLGGLMRLVAPDDLRELAARAGLTQVSSKQVPLARAKSFQAAIFAKTAAK